MNQTENKMRATLADLLKRLSAGDATAKDAAEIKRLRYELRLIESAKKNEGKS